MQARGEHGGAGKGQNRSKQAFQVRPSSARRWACQYIRHHPIQTIDWGEAGQVPRDFLVQQAISKAPRSVLVVDRTFPALDVNLVAQSCPDLKGP